MHITRLTINFNSTPITLEMVCLLYSLIYSIDLMYDYLNFLWFRHEVMNNRIELWMATFSHTEEKWLPILTIFILCMCLCQCICMWCGDRHSNLCFFSAEFMVKGELGLQRNFLVLSRREMRSEVRVWCLLAIPVSSTQPANGRSHLRLGIVVP